MKLHPTQKIVTKDTHRFRVLRCGRRWGKALALDTPILTTNGFKNLIDVRVGDYVFDERGEAVEVLYKSEIYYDRKCYAVHFSDGNIIVADANHDWVVEDKSYRKNLPRSGNVKKIKITTEQIKQNLRTPDGKESNYSIELIAKKLKGQDILIKEQYKRRYITKVEEIPSVPVQCLMVNSPSHLFLAGYGLIPTHNTAVIIEEMKALAVSRPSRIAYIAKNYQQARDIVWDRLNKEMKGAILSTNEARLEMRVSTVDGKESIIFLRGWESIENLLGQSFDLLCIDEVAYMGNFWASWEHILRPTLTDRKGSVIFSSTPNGFNHFYDLCNKEMIDIDYKTFHFKSEDNPFLPKEEIERAKNTLPEDVYVQEYEAEFTKKSGLVYKEFDRKKHLYEKLPDTCYDWDYIGGIDFGYQNPAAVLHIYTDGDKFYVENEWYKTQRTDAQIAEYTAACNFRAVYPDPENPGGIEELRKRKVNTREVVKGKGSVIAGIQKIRELLISGRLKINQKCLNLISEFEMYSYDENTHSTRSGITKNINELPVKAYDHGLDALRYVILTYKPISAIMKEQEEVWARNRRALTGTTR